MVSRAKRGRAGAGAGAGAVAVGDVIVVGGKAPQPQRLGVERNAVNNAELRANAQNVLSMIHEYRPKNTSLAYEPKQAEFQDFCRRKQYHDGDTVTEEKLVTAVAPCLLGLATAEALRRPGPTGGAWHVEKRGPVG